MAPAELVTEVTAQVLTPLRRRGLHTTAWRGSDEAGGVDTAHAEICSHPSMLRQRLMSV